MGGDGHSPAAALSLGLEKPRGTTNKPDQHHSRHQVQPPVKRITGDISQGKGGCRIIPNSRLLLVSLKCICLLAEGNVLCISASLFPAKKSVTVFDTVAVAVSGNTMASRLIFNSSANNATVSNRGLLRPSSISMMVRTLMCRLSASALWVRCRFARAARRAAAKESTGFFILTHLIYSLVCANAHINNHSNHIW